jgi:hypothetical protein
VTARGVPAIKAVQRLLAFAVYSRPFVVIALALILGWQILLPGVGALRNMAGLSDHLRRGCPGKALEARVFDFFRLYDKVDIDLKNL